MSKSIEEIAIPLWAELCSVHTQCKTSDLVVIFARRLQLALTPAGEMGDEEVLHIWDTRVGQVSGKFPLCEGDVLNFARAIESRTRVPVSGELPPLPEPHDRVWLKEDEDDVGIYTADQMRQYAIESRSMMGRGQEPKLAGTIERGKDGLFVALDDEIAIDKGLIGAGVYILFGEAPTDLWLQKVMQAYGHLWHVKNDPFSPRPEYSPEMASTAARQALRDLLTHEQRGKAINDVQAILGDNPAQSPTQEQGEKGKQDA